MARPVTVEIPHRLGRAEARDRLESGFGQLASQIGTVGQVEKAWDGDALRFSMTAVGQAISGVAHVADDVVRLEVVLPGFLALIAGKVKGAIQKEGQVLLEDKRR
jgi:putative polyhydroxyalkanoate system protein